MRPRVSVFLGVSIDGYIAGEGGSLEWLSIVETDPPEDTGYAALMADVDALVIGRNTYDAVIGFTPAVRVQRQARDRADHAPR